MSSIQQDLSILNKFNFEKPPVGIKFLLTKPEGIKRVGRRLNFCEMLPEAQKGKPFYATKEDITCVGPLYLGMLEGGEPIFESGKVGPKMGLFNDARVNRQLYDVIARIPQGSVKYMAFAPLDKLSFAPDVLLVTADPVQAGTLKRATNYSSLKMWTSKMPPAIECNWVYIHPFLTGEVYYQVILVPGFGMGRLRPGTILISFPYQFLPILVKNLQEMEWELYMDKLAQESIPKFKKRMEEICEEVAAEIGEKRDSRMLP